MAFTLSRRNALLGTMMLLTVAAAGFGSLAAYDISDHIWRVLFRLLGPFEMAEADMAAFSRDFTRPIDLEGWTGWMLRAGGWSHLDAHLAASGPPGIQDRFESFDRTLLGAFILSTNYLEVLERGGGTVVYYGLGAPCANPFARFD